MVHYITSRLLQSVIALIGIMVVVFFILHLTGDPVRLMLPPEASEGDYQAMKVALGMDKPLGEQFLRFMWGAAHGDFGKSLRFRGQSALELVVERFPATLELASAALGLSLLLSLPLGVIAAIKRHSIIDNIAMTVALVGQAMPNFWLALMLITVFAVKFGVLPSSGRSGPKSLILPAVTLALFMIARTTRVVRSSMLEVLGEDYVRTARGKGLSETTVILRHALRNAVLPVITIIGLDFGTLMGGAVVTETVFAWPGLGRLLYQSLLARDYPVLMGMFIVVSVMVILAMLVTDLTYVILNPRIRFA